MLEEYFNQSDREKIEGLPVAPFMDREKVTKPSAQIGFIKFVLIPMFEAISKVKFILNLSSWIHLENLIKKFTKKKLFPQLEEVMVKPLNDAYERYQEMKIREENKSLES